MDSLIKFVTEKQHETMEVDLIQITGRIVRVQLGIVKFAVTTDRSIRASSGRYLERLDVIGRRDDHLLSRFDRLVRPGDPGLSRTDLPLEFLYLSLLLLNDLP